MNNFSSRVGYSLQGAMECFSSVTEMVGYYLENPSNTDFPYRLVDGEPTYDNAMLRYYDASGMRREINTKKTGSGLRRRNSSSDCPILPKKENKVMFIMGGDGETTRL